MCDLLTQYVELSEGQTHSSKMCVFMDVGTCFLILFCSLFNFFPVHLKCPYMKGQLCISV